jgi:hypothetical protein
MTLAGPDRRFLCSNGRERGDAVCANGGTAKAADVESRVLAAIQEKLLLPDLIEAAMAEYVAAKAAASKSRRARRLVVERDLGEVKRRLERLIIQVEKGRLWPRSATGIANPTRAVWSWKANSQLRRKTTSLHSIPRPPAGGGTLSTISAPP